MTHSDTAGDKRVAAANGNAARLRTHGLGEGYGEVADFEIVECRSSYDICYPRSGDLALLGILSDGGAIDLRIRIGRRDGGVAAVEYQVRNQPLQQVADGVILVCFDREPSAEDSRAQTCEIRVREPGSPRWSRLQLTYYSAARYSASGRVQHGHDRVHVTYSDLPLPGTRIGDWILSEPTPDECDYARHRWGAVIAEAGSAWERVRRLGVMLIQELEPHRGTPSDVMDTLSPFAMHERLLRGEDHCWCANISFIFCNAANALGLPMRCVIMRNQLCPPPDPGESGMEVLMAGGHTICEFFDEESDQWFWIDLTLRAVGVSLGEVGPLNLWELHHFLNEPRHRHHLVFDCVDPETGVVIRKSLRESGLEPQLMNCLKRDQRLVYLRGVDPSSPT